VETNTTSAQFSIGRPTAVGMIVMSATMLLGLALVLQVLGWEYRLLLYHRFGWENVDNFPEPTRHFALIFGYRPTERMLPVMSWFVWPMVVTFLHAHWRYREPREFTLAFLFGFVLSWLCIGAFVIVVLSACAMGFVILLADIDEPQLPVIDMVITLVSLLLPIAVLILAIYECRRSRSNALTEEKTQAT
jgi:hypothetical protein